MRHEMVARIVELVKEMLQEPQDINCEIVDVEVQGESIRITLENKNFDARGVPPGGGRRL